MDKTAITTRRTTQDHQRKQTIRFQMQKVCKPCFEEHSEATLSKAKLRVQEGHLEEQSYEALLGNEVGETSQSGTWMGRTRTTPTEHPSGGM